MRISDWSSDVCSSDLCDPRLLNELLQRPRTACIEQGHQAHAQDNDPWFLADPSERIEQFTSDAKEQGASDTEDLHPRRQGFALFHILAVEVRVMRGVGVHRHALGHSSHEEKRGEGHRSEEHTSELQSLMRISYAVFFLKKK